MTRIVVYAHRYKRPPKKAKAADSACATIARAREPHAAPPAVPANEQAERRGHKFTTPSAIVVAPIMHVFTAGVLLLLAVVPARADEQPVDLKPGPGQDVVQAECNVCHSLDYIRMNSPFLTAEAWKVEVTKMRTAFGVEDAYFDDLWKNEPDKAREIQLDRLLVSGDPKLVERCEIESKVAQLRIGSDPI